MRIGILTGGGDVPGLNPCIRSITLSADDLGWEAVGFRRGWEGVLAIDPADPASVAANSLPLTREGVRGIDRMGGTILHTSRTDPRTVGEEDQTGHVLRVLEALGIDAMITLGSDGTLRFSAHLSAQGVPVVSVPKTMDNDVFGTDYCIGFSTAVTRSVDAIHALRTPTGSHERIGVVELFGRNSGETTLISGYLADVNRVIISEVPFDIKRLAHLLVEDRRRNPSHYAMMVISEGASMIGGQVVEYGQVDAYGHKKLGGIGQIVGDALKRLTGVDIVNQQLAYLMRAGAPDSLDRMVAVSYGNLAVQLIAEGYTGRMVALREGTYTTVPVETPTQGTKRVDVGELYDADRYRPRVAHLLGKPMFLY